MSESGSEKEMAEPLVDVVDVSVTRGGNEILRDIRFAINPGEHWVLLGPNGAGKTTLARLISARTYPDSGTVTALGADTSSEDGEYLASRIGVASQDVRDRLPQGDTVISLVMASAWGLLGQFDEDYEPADAQRAQDLSYALGIGDLKGRSFSTLSEGEKQRVSIARALMADPEILILDEPTAGLDLGARETLVSALSEIMSDRNAPSIVLITHEIEEIAPGFTNVALLRDGKLLEAGPIEATLTAPLLSDTFGLPLEVVKQGDRYWAFASGG